MCSPAVEGKGEKEPAALPLRHCSGETRLSCFIHLHACGAQSRLAGTEGSIPDW